MLFNQKHELLETHCGCPSGTRTIGGCAHAIAVLKYISDKSNGIPLKLSRSERLFYDGFLAGASESEKKERQRLLWKASGNLSDSDSESENESELDSDSETDSDSSSDSDTSDNDKSSNDSDLCEDSSGSD